MYILLVGWDFKTQRESESERHILNYISVSTFRYASSRRVAYINFKYAAA